jgi:hypothetical protein
MEMIRNNRIGIIGGQSFSSNDLQWTIIRFGHQGVKYAEAYRGNIICWYLEWAIDNKTLHAQYK